MLERANLATAFLAGLLSFFSPCTLPLVPLYLGHLAGATNEELLAAGAGGRARLLGNAAAFVIGFTLVFVILFGLPAGLVARLLQGHRSTLLQAGGVFLIVLGLNTLGVVRTPAFLREWRPGWQPGGRRRGGLSASFLVGTFFGLGWTPCVGAILGAITMLAATGRDPAGAVLLLATYSLGFGCPFLLVAAGFDRAVPALGRLRRRLPTLNGLAGAFIMLIGVTMLFGAYQGFFARLVRLAPWRPPL